MSENCNGTLLKQGHLQNTVAHFEPPKKPILCLNISLLVIPRWNILLNIVGILSCDIGVLEVEEKVLKDFNLQYTMYYHYT